MENEDGFYRAILDNVTDGVYFCDTDRRISYWNQGAERITGFSADQVRGRSCADQVLVHVDERGTSLCGGDCPLAATLKDGEPRETQAFLHHSSGHRVPVLIRTNPIFASDGSVVGVVETFSDNSALIEALRRVDELSEQSEQDALTQVANRRSMELKLRACLDECSAFGKAAGLLFLDIDHFKDINDTHGHEAGDEVLKMVAKTLKHNLRSTDVLARWGGDEFLALIYGASKRVLGLTAQKLRALVESSFVEVGGLQLRVTISAGGTLLRCGETPESVVARADDFLYKSKTTGRNRSTIES